MTRAGLDFLTEELASLRARDLLREPRFAPAGLSLSSNDYLGLAAEPVTERGHAGAGASALVTGYHPEHAAAERALAAWVGAEEALLFSSGYAANVGALSALAGPGDLIVSDALNHASIIDGCRLSRATVAVYPHRDLDAASEALTRARDFRRAFLVTESYFGMDGTSADLLGLRAAADRAGAALVVDEAHALGVLGPEGAGLSRALDARPDVLVGTLGKAVGLHGAFVAGSASLRLFLWNRARSFVFSTATSPASAAAIPARVERVRAADARREEVRALAAAMREALGPSVGGAGHILPWVLGEPAAALAAQARLAAEGLVGLAIRPPTVPVGTARIRLAARAGLSSGERARVLDGLERASKG